MNADQPISNDKEVSSPAKRCVCIDWYSEGETKVVEVNGVWISVRFVGRKGRRGRIAIEAPAGAVFQTAFNRST